MTVMGTRQLERRSEGLGCGKWIEAMSVKDKRPRFEQQARAFQVRRACVAFVVVMSCLSAPNLQARSYVNFAGFSCSDTEIPAGAFNYYEQAKFRPKSQRITDDPRLKHIDWAINDNYQAHLEPALKAMRTELGQGRGGSVSANLHFTLVRIPNHPKALAAIVDYAFEIKKHPRHQRLVNQPECYLQRAMDYAPKDPGPHSIMGVYLFKLMKYEDALKALDDAAKLDPQSSEISYNRGLTLFKLGRYEYAVEAARHAYGRGYPLGGLRRMLRSKGYSIEKGATANPVSEDP